MKTAELLAKLQWEGLTEEYLQTLGSVVMFFSHAEWIAACCCGAMEERYLERFGNPKDKTSATIIAKDLIRLSEEQDGESYQEQLLIEAFRFKALVEDERNALLHSYPASIDGSSVILYNSQRRRKFDIVSLEDYLGCCYDCWQKLLVIFHDHLDKGGRTKHVLSNMHENHKA